MNSRNLVIFVGIALLAFGIFSYSYGYLAYTTNEKVAEIGNVEITATQERAVSIPPTLSAVSGIAGLLLITAALFSKRK